VPVTAGTTAFAGKWRSAWHGVGHQSQLVAVPTSFPRRTAGRRGSGFSWRAGLCRALLQPVQPRLVRLLHPSLTRDARHGPYRRWERWANLDMAPYRTVGGCVGDNVRRVTAERASECGVWSSAGVSRRLSQADGRGGPTGALRSCRDLDLLPIRSRSRGAVRKPTSPRQKRRTNA
jgi:hypothetical protein